MRKRLVAVGAAALMAAALVVGVSGAQAKTTYTPAKGLMFEANGGQGGGKFTVSNKPINADGVQESVTSTGIRLSVPYVDNGGYRDAGVFMKAGTVQKFADNGYHGSMWNSVSDPTAQFTNVWFDVNKDNSFFGTSNPRVYTGADGSDQFGLLSADGKSVTFNNGGTCTFAAMTPATCHGVGPDTLMAVEVGLMNDKGSASMTVTGLNGAATVQGMTTPPPYTVSKIYAHSVCRGGKGQWWTISNVAGGRTVKVTTHTRVGAVSYHYRTYYIGAGQSVSFVTSHGGYLWGHYYDHGRTRDGGKLVYYRTHGAASGHHDHTC